MPETPTEPFLKVWEHHVFEMLIEKGRIKPQLANDMRQWDHTGFSVHKGVHIEDGDEEGLSRLSRYIARCALNDSEEVLLGRPVAGATITQDSVEDDVIYGADHPNPLPFQEWRANPDSTTTKRNFEVYDPLDFLAQVTQHIPGRGQHLTRYYGWYSNKSRGMRAKEDHPERSDTTFVDPAPEAHQSACPAHGQGGRRL